MATSTKALKPTTLLVVSKLGAKYKPLATSAQGNKATWGTIVTACGKAPQTYGSLIKLVTTKHNHAPMVGYCVRRGWLVAK